MLKKMLKYDIQSMSKTFLPFFAAILVISLLSAISMHVEWLIGIFGGGMVLFGLIVGLLVTSLVLIITRFYQTVLGDQGYLTHTLPVDVDTIILSKLFSAIFWLIASGIVAILAFLIILLGSVDSIGGFFQAFVLVIQGALKALTSPEYYSETSSVILSLFLLIILVVSAIANEILHFYCAMACSQIYPFSKNRIVGSVIAYLIINVLLSIIVFVFSTVLGLGTYQVRIESFSPTTLLPLALFIIILVVTAFNLMLYLPTRYLLKNKLNLE